MEKPEYKAPDLRERGREDQRSDRRLYMQLQAYTGCADPAPLIGALKESALETALYLDVTDPQGVALLALTENPEDFTGPFRRLLAEGPFAGLTRRPGLTMIGRTYGIGREPNLDFALAEKPRRTALNPDWPWAVWYPLRRRPEFATLAPGEQGKILYEHAVIGMAWGQCDYAHDLRFACHGLDRDDNEFVIGLVGKDLHPLSMLVQEMRKTVQTSRYIETLGPFFTGRVAWQSPLRTS